MWTLWSSYICSLFIMLKEDRKLLAATHLSQLLDLVSGIGGFVVPLVIWLFKRDEVLNLDDQARQILNFRISMFIYIVLCLPLLIFGVGFIGLLIISILYLVFPILNAIRANNGQETSYPLALKIL
ncbi:MAG: tRNA modification GTPase [Flavobacteriaceae bacterium]|nr:tRNA modification GTPase [Flavobacteriaceae bacterium]